MNEPSTVIFDIQKFSVHDGPGIRTTVFLKGCSLRCVWCHNPESHSAIPELFFHSEKCNSCGICVKGCPRHAHYFTPDGEHRFDRTLCTVCGKCADLCPASALERCGKTMTVSEVLKEVDKDLPFYRDSGGGLTLSGGEPMMSFDFTLALLRGAKQRKDRLDTAIETCGFAPVKQYAEILPFLDHVLFDIKSLIPEKHLRFTGVPLEPILETLYFLDRAGAEISLRCPIIPSLNDSEEELRKITELANALSSVHSIDLEPYHPLGVSKSLQLGKKSDYSAPFAPHDCVEKIIGFMHSLTKIPVRKA